MAPTIDLYSDTATLPSEGMKQAMFGAPLGDEQKGEDPTTLALEALAAKLLGKEEALFLPSSTMANQIALLLHCERGDETIAAENAHIFAIEGGAPAVWAQTLARLIETPTGIFDPSDIRRKTTLARGPNFPLTRLVCVENTTNMGGGLAWPLAKLQGVWQTCRELDLRCHLDGSRLFNAAVATSASPAQLTAGFDTITLCLSKGLGCPAGALLVLPRSLRPTARLWKQRMGGSLRQSGILAAAGLYALEHHLEGLAQDHLNARALAHGLQAIGCLDVERAEGSTNMVFFHLRPEAPQPGVFERKCLEQGFRFSKVGPTRYRAVTHRGIEASQIEFVLQQIATICQTA